jgi:S-adenosylmethionine:tRNA ribosyltransferase-isomerase
MKTSDLDYDLPSELVAQYPSEQRDASRLLVLDRADGAIHEDLFQNVACYLRQGDCVVLNETRVIRARLLGRKTTGGRVEVFLLRKEAPAVWEALIRPSAKVKPGAVIHLAGGLTATAGEILPGGRRRIRFDRPEVLAYLEEIGEVPLPPYIHRKHPDASDLTRYQTIYARTEGAVAAPTAGLHFTEDVFRSLDQKGVRSARLVLHVGYGTFRPIQTEKVEQHRLEPEEFDFPEDAAQVLNETRDAGGRVVAIGTTVTRVLETQYSGGRFRQGHGRTDRFIYPPYVFLGVDVLQTNFHLPRSSLLALVYAFAGAELVQKAYAYAIRQRFRFYSYGDVVLIR